MGDISDDVLNGVVDEVTGEYIGDKNLETFGCEVPGFPVTYQYNRDEPIEELPNA